MLKRISGLIVAITIIGASLLAQTITYTYDNNHRLKAVTYNNGSILYQYDNAHNLKRVRSIFDADADSLDDNWEVSNFGSITAATATSDSDQDGVNDIDKQASGTDPVDPSSSLKIMTAADQSIVGYKTSWTGETNVSYFV
ncbi:MAG: hypothetical protein GKR87_10575 [Kiritimatiellae bacterium]|nr:hypothetical protein [Kiritimatiellia bacterium]